MGAVVEALGPLTLGLQGPAPGAPAPGKFLGLGLPLGWAFGACTPEGAAACVTPFHTGPQVEHGRPEALFFCSVHGPGPTSMSSLAGPLPPVLSCLSRHIQTLLQAPDQSPEGSGASALHCFPREGTDAYLGSNSPGTHLLPF